LLCLVCTAISGAGRTRKGEDESGRNKYEGGRKTGRRKDRRKERRRRGAEEIVKQEKETAVGEEGTGDRWGMGGRGREDKEGKVA